MKDNLIVDLNGIFNEYFFKKFTFILDGKPIRIGRLKLFNMKGFNLKFFLIDENSDIKNLEIPYPFSFSKTKEGYLFDYRISAFKLIKKPELVDNLTEQDFIKSRYYNKPLYIKIE